MFAPRSRILLILLLSWLVLVVGCSTDTPLGPESPEENTLTIKVIPPGYYDLVNTSSPALLRSTLHQVIDDHTKIPYTSSSTDTWNVLELADQDPNDSGRILDVYLNASYQKYGAGNLDYNREHTWPKSYGFPDDDYDSYPYSDCHQLFLCNDSYNTSRSNKPFRNAGATASEKPTQLNDGAGGGTGVYPGNSNWTSGSFTSGAWETWIGRRGDIARAMFYMDIRYEGGTHGVTGYDEPDLILTDNQTLIENSNTGSPELVAYMGILSVLLDWHVEDPVDDKERHRNDTVYNYQGNRNPFIDHPEWVDCVFGGVCGGEDTTPPEAPVGLVAIAGDGTVTLNWDDNIELDLEGYTVYRSTTLGGPYSSLNVDLIPTSQYLDADLVNDTTYYYLVTATDTSGNESLSGSEVSATPTAGSGGGPVAWINEFHYDNAGTDTGEFFEIAGTAGLDLTGWTVHGYNGNGGSVYDTVALSGILPDQQDGFGTLSFAMVGMQNGSPDGLALTNDTGDLVLFISYEGTITASSGPASGTTSEDILVSESSSTPIGHSLQLGGTGATYGDFTWQWPQAATSGLVNSGQTLGDGLVDPVADFTISTTSGNIPLTVFFSDLSTGDPTNWSWQFGDGAGSNAQNPSHTYTLAGTYSVSLTVTNTNGTHRQTYTDLLVVSDPTTGGWTTITYDDFESGMGSFTSGGSNMSLHAGEYSHQGTYSANIQDGNSTESSFFHTLGHDVSGFTNLEVEFWFTAEGMNKIDEGFLIQYWDGSSWLTVARYAKGLQFENGIFYHQVVRLPASDFNYPTDAKLRFMCDASDETDNIFIDEIEFRGFI